MKKKVFGIGAASLLLLIGFIPATTSGVFLEEVSFSTNSKILITDNEIDWDKILVILKNHEAEIKEINQYVQRYISEHGHLDENFILPVHLEEKLDVIIKECGGKPPQGQNKVRVGDRSIISCLVQGLSKLINYFKTKQNLFLSKSTLVNIYGGKTDYEREWITFFGIPIGYIDKIWLDSGAVYWICKVMGPMGLAAIAIVLILTGVGATISIAFVIASLLTGYGLDEIYEMGRENGIYAEITDPFIYDTIPAVLTYLGSQ